MIQFALGIVLGGALMFVFVEGDATPGGAASGVDGVVKTIELAAADAPTVPLPLPRLAASGRDAEAAVGVEPGHEAMADPKAVAQRREPPAVYVYTPKPVAPPQREPVATPPLQARTAIAPIAPPDSSPPAPSAASSFVAGGAAEPGSDEWDEPQIKWDDPPDREWENMPDGGWDDVPQGWDDGRASQTEWDDGLGLRPSKAGKAPSSASPDGAIAPAKPGNGLAEREGTRALPPVDAGGEVGAGGAAGDAGASGEVGAEPTEAERSELVRRLLALYHRMGEAE